MKVKKTSKDTEKISRKGTAACKSINIKLNKIEKDMKILQENRKLQEENRAYKNCKMEITKLRKEKTAIETELNKSQTVISYCDIKLWYPIFFLTVLMTTLSYQKSVTTFFFNLRLQRRRKLIRDNESSPQILLGRGGGEFNKVINVLSCALYPNHENNSDFYIMYIPKRNNGSKQFAVLKREF